MTRRFELKVVWDPDFPPEIRGSLAEFEDLADRLLPRWVEILRVRWYPELEAVAEATVEEEYRRVMVRVGPSFLDTPDRLNVMVHELAHAYTVPIARTLRNSLSHFGDATTGKVLEELIVHKVEESNCDLADLICRLLK